jgi:hypothetical protein
VHIESSSQIVNGIVVVLLFSPESEVLLEEFDDALGVTEIVFLELVNFVKGVLEGLVSEVAGGLVVLHGFVVEDREVEGKSELDRIARREVDGVGFVVSFEGRVLNFIKVITLGVLSNVTVVVSDHLDKESLGLSVAGFGKNLILNHIDDSLAIVLELGFDAGFISEKSVGELGVFGVLLNSSDGAASSSLGTDKVFESNGQKVALI